MRKPTTIFVTGAAGFIGSNTCKKLLERNIEIVGLDNFDPFYPRIFKDNNIKFLRTFENFHFVEGDIRNTEILRSLFKQYSFDAVIHLAAKAGVRPSIEDPNIYADVNYLGTSNILSVMREFDVKNMVFASSSSVYGNQHKIPFSESDDIRTPISPYAASKLGAEKLCYTFHHLHDFNITNLRFFTVYGPGQRPEMAIHKFVRSAFDQKPITMFGDGSSARDYTFISDIVDGIEASLFNLKGFEIYNLGNSYPIELKTLISMIGELSGKSIEIVKMESQPGDVDITYADINHATKQIGYKPKISLADGLKEFIAWYEVNIHSKKLCCA